jgi:putative copper resistance protein D
MVPFNLHNSLTQWQFGPFALVVVATLIALAIWYLRADWNLAARGRAWQRTRTLSFMGALVAVDLALQSPVATYTGTYFQAHVLQHLLLMVVAPPLAALGAPSTLLLQTSSRSLKERWLRILRSRTVAVITHPISAWILYFGAMIVFFLSPLINVAMHHMALMDLINVIFLFGGTLYWWPMVGIDPIMHWKMNYGGRMLNILLGTGIEAFLGVAIIASSHPIASMYTLSSTKSGGALLWVSTEFVTLGAFLPIFLQWMHSEERIAARYEATLDRDAAPRTLDLPEGNAAGSASGPRSAWEAEWLARTGTIPVFNTTNPAAPTPRS